VIRAAGQQRLDLPPQAGGAALVGIKQEDLDRIFKAFYTTKPESAGAGLGLCIARSGLSEHGGEIAVDSEFGKGTTFTLMLPVYVQRTSFAKSTTLPKA